MDDTGYRPLKPGALRILEIQNPRHGYCHRFFDPSYADLKEIARDNELDFDILMEDIYEMKSNEPEAYGMMINVPVYLEHQDRVRLSKTSYNG